MKKVLVALVILSVCIGYLVGYVFSVGPKKALEVTKSLLFGYNNTGSIRVEYMNYNVNGSREDELSEKEEKPLLRENDDLFNGLKLNDPEDLKGAANVILDAADKYRADRFDKKWIPENRDLSFNIMTLEANADIVYAAYAFYLENGGKEIPQVSEKLAVIDKEFQIDFAQFDPKFVYSGGEESTVAVLMEYTSAGGMNHIVPTFIAVSRDSGKTWDYRFTTYNICSFFVSEDGDFVYLSNYYSGTYVHGDHPSMVYFDRSKDSVRYQYVSIVPGYQYHYHVAMDVLSLSEGIDKDLSDHYVTIGYRGSKETKEDESYFLIVKYNDLNEENKEVLFIDDDFAQKLSVIVQSMCEPEYYHSEEKKEIVADVDFVFPHSNDRYLNYDEIVAWKQFAEEIQEHYRFDASECYKLILRRAINEIYARKGYDFTGTTYTLFNNSEWYKEIPKHKIADEDFNEYEKHNIDLLAVIEAENQ